MADGAAAVRPARRGVPGQTIGLRVFEERYIAMMEDVLRRAVRDRRDRRGAEVGAVGYHRIGVAATVDDYTLDDDLRPRRAGRRPLSLVRRTADHPIGRPLDEVVDATPATWVRRRRIAYLGAIGERNPALPRDALGQLRGRGGDARLTADLQAL
jgi:hypothetical protein